MTRSGGQEVVDWSLIEPCQAAGGQPQTQPPLFRSSLMFSYYVCVTFTSSFSVSVSLAAWDLVAFLKEKVDRVPVLPLV